MKQQKMKRRNFIKAGIGTGLSIIGLKQLFSAPSTGIRAKNSLPGKGEEKQMEIFLEYGGEFSQVKPQLKSRRKNHGSI